MAGSHPGSAQIGLLDGLVTRVLQTYPYRFTICGDRGSAPPGCRREVDDWPDGRRARSGFRT
jgi:hypothetical protein